MPDNSPSLIGSLNTALISAGERLAAESRQQLERRFVALGYSWDLWEELKSERGWDDAYFLRLLHWWEKPGWEAVDKAVERGDEDAFCEALAAIANATAEEVHEWPCTVELFHAAHLEESGTSDLRRRYERRP